MDVRLGDGLRGEPDGAARLRAVTAGVLVPGEQVTFGTAWPARSRGKHTGRAFLALTNARTLVLNDDGALIRAALHADAARAHLEDPKILFLVGADGLTLPILRLSPADHRAVRDLIQEAAGQPVDAGLDGRVREHLEQAPRATVGLQATGASTTELIRAVWRLDKISRQQTRTAAADEQRAITEERRAEQERRAQAAGQQTCHEAFGGWNVTIYDSGHVRLGRWARGDLEVLVAIEASADVQKKSAAGRAAGAVLTAGVNLAGSNQRGDVWLTITTTENTHVLHADPPTASNLAAAKRLEAAGRAVAGRAVATQPAGEPAGDEDIAARLERLDGLRDRGLVNDAEYAERRTAILNDL